jgi:hypothetical protein
VKRRLFNVLAGVSLVLCVAMATIWIRSTHVADSFGWGNAKNYHFIDLDSGRIVFWSGWGDGMPPPAERWHYRSMPPMFPNSGLSLTPIADYGPNYDWIGIPCWVFLLALMIPPTRWAWHAYRRAHEIGIGHCPVCNYDLRATPDRCPECGTNPQKR